MTTDPIADFLIRLKNASRIKRTTASVPYSKLKEAIANLLLAEGYVKAVETHGKKAGHRMLDIELLYSDKNVSKITEVQRLSKSGHRIYSSSAELKSSKHNMTVVSTSLGLMTTKEAKRRKLGGEVFFTIW